MAFLLPPQPVGVPPGHSMWNDWYEKLRTAFNNGQVAVTWANIDFTGSNITDIVTRPHNNLQSLQGGTAGEYYHTTAAQNTLISSLASGTYTPTLTNGANIASSTAYTCQYLRVGDIVHVSGKMDIALTAASTSSTIDISLPIASNLTSEEQLAGTAVPNSLYPDGLCAAIRGEATNNRATMTFLIVPTTSLGWYWTFTYRIL